MNCQEFKHHLQIANEERRSPDLELLAAHLRTCAICAREWNQYQLLERAIVAWNDDVPRVDLADAIVSRWLVEAPEPISFQCSDVVQAAHHSDRASSRSTSPASAPVLLARNHVEIDAPRRRGRSVIWISAILPMLLFASLWLVDSPRHSNTRRLTSSPIAQTDQPADRQDIPQLDTLMADLESNYRVLTQSAVSTISDATMLFPTGNRSLWTENILFDSAMPATDRDELAPRPTVPNPVRQGLSKALDLLMEVVPETDATTSS